MPRIRHTNYISSVEEQSGESDVGEAPVLYCSGQHISTVHLPSRGRAEDARLRQGSQREIGVRAQKNQGDVLSFHRGQAGYVQDVRTSDGEIRKHYGVPGNSRIAQFLLSARE